jgi:hypothetical protein
MAKIVEVSDRIEFAGCVASILAEPLIAVAYGLALRTLWRWFITADFGLKPLTWHAALGLAVVVALLAKPLPAQSDKSSSWYGLVMRLAWPAYAFVLGWLYHISTRGLA